MVGLKEYPNIVFNYCDNTILIILDLSKKYM